MARKARSLSSNYSRARIFRRDSHSHAACPRFLPEGKKPRDYQKARIEADLARWIKDAGLQKLRADSWSGSGDPLSAQSVAPDDGAARRVGLPVAIQSESDLRGDNPAYAWLTALLMIMTDPLNAYEIVGVLARSSARPITILPSFPKDRKRDFASTRFYRRPQEYP